MNSPLQVYCLAGSHTQRQALERFLEALPEVRNLGSGPLQQAVPAHADVLLAEVAPGESLPIAGSPPFWLVLCEQPPPHCKAQGFVPRRISEADLEVALRAVAAGFLIHHPDLAPAAPAETRLSEREQEVLACLALGQSNREIARQLSITEHTVKFHLTSLFQKLKASRRSQAVAAGVRSGLIRI